MPTRQGDAGFHEARPRAGKPGAGRLFFIGPDVSGGDHREVKGFGDRLILNPQSDPFFGRQQVADPAGLIDPDAKALLPGLSDQRKKLVAKVFTQQDTR